MIASKPLQIRTLQYRRPRRAAAIAISFSVDGEVFLGACQDLSDSGIRASFGRSLPVGINGVLTLHHHGGPVTRPAQVACLEGSTVGLSFLSDEPCTNRHTIALVRKPSHTV